MVFFAFSVQQFFCCFPRQMLCKQISGTPLTVLFCFFFVFFQVNKNIIDISIPRTFVEDNGKSSTAAGQMIKVNCGIENVEL